MVGNGAYHRGDRGCIGMYEISGLTVEDGALARS